MENSRELMEAYALIQDLRFLNMISAFVFLSLSFYVGFVAGAFSFWYNFARL